ncbi:MAG: hypothetical protein R2941_04680 [Desulfobacterales bacterium]
MSPSRGDFQKISGDLAEYRIAVDFVQCRRFFVTVVPSLCPLRQNKSGGKHGFKGESV